MQCSGASVSLVPCAPLYHPGPLISCPPPLLSYRPASWAGFCRLCTPLVHAHLCLPPSHSLRAPLIKEAADSPACLWALH